MKTIGGGSLPRGIIMITNEAYSFVIKESDGTLTEETGPHSDQYKKSKTPFIRGYVNIACQNNCLYGFVIAWIKSILLTLHDKILSNTDDNNEIAKELFSKTNEQLKEKTKINSVSSKKHSGSILSIIFYIILPLIIGSNPKSFTICFSTMLLLSIVFKNILSPFTRKYHAAEHMAINCYLEEKDITMENVKNSSRLSTRCGTNFEVIKDIFLITSSILLCVFIQNYLLYLLLHCVALLISTGIAYELIGIDSKLFPLNWPGLLFQYFISTGKPTEVELEVAIKAIEKII